MPFRNESKKTSLIIFLFSFHYSKCSHTKKIFLSASGLTEGLEELPDDKIRGSQLWAKETMPAGPTWRSCPGGDRGSAERCPPPLEKAPAWGCREPGSKQVSTHPCPPARRFQTQGGFHRCFLIFKKGVELEILGNSAVRLEPLGLLQVVPEPRADALAVGKNRARTGRHLSAALPASPQNVSLTPGQVYAWVYKNRSSRYCHRFVKQIFLSERREFYKNHSINSNSVTPFLQPLPHACDLARRFTGKEECHFYQE